MSDEMFQRHAALLGDQRLSHPANAGQRAEIVKRIQRDYGNSYVQRLVEHVSSRPSGDVQAKLEVGAADDKFEREADKIAKEVVRNADVGAESVNQTNNGQVQRAEDSTPVSEGISVFERLVGSMAIVVSEFNGGAWRDEFASRLQPSYVLITQLLQTLGGQKSLSTEDLKVLKAVNEFAMLNLGLQAQVKGGGNAGGSVPDLRKLLGLVKTSSNLLDDKGKSSLLSWLPGEVVAPPADAIWGEAKKPAPAKAEQGSNAGEAGKKKDSPYGVPIFVDDQTESQYAKTPVDVGPVYAKTPVDVGEGKMKESPYGGIFVDDKEKKEAKNANKKEESPYGVAIPVDEQTESQYAKTPVDVGPVYAKTPVDVGEGKMKESPYGGIFSDAKEKKEAKNANKKEESPYGKIIPLSKEQEEERLKMAGRKGKK